MNVILENGFKFNDLIIDHNFICAGNLPPAVVVKDGFWNKAKAIWYICTGMGYNPQKLENEMTVEIKGECPVKFTNTLKRRE